MINLKQFILPATLGSVLLMNIGMTEAQEVEMPLFLNEALDKAQVDNPTLRAVGIQRQLQQARIEQAGVKPRPQLNVEVEDAFGSGVNDLLQGVEATASVSWLLERGLRQSRVAAASARSSLVESSLR